MDVVTENPRNSHAGLQALTLERTPNGEFFCRNHFEFPQKPLASLELESQLWTLERLQSLPRVAQIVTLECAGNGRTLFDPLPVGTPWGTRAVSTAEFGGTRVAELLQAAGMDAFQYLWFRGSEGDYERSLSREEFEATQPLVVWEMNGQPLPTRHGGPLRLVVPGYYAMASIKWLSSIRRAPEPSLNYYQAEDYLFKTAHAPVRPVTWMRAKSMITHVVDPQGQVHLPQNELTLSGPCQLQGWAWGSTAVESVWIDLQGLEPIPANLHPPLGAHAWRGFSASLDLSPGRYRAASRCRLTSGEEQPVEAEWNQQGYENNSCLPVSLTVQ